MNRPNASSSSTNSIYDIEVIISQLLRWGVFISLVLIAVGTLLSFFHSHDYGLNGGTNQDFQWLIRPDAVLKWNVSEFLLGLLHANGQSLIIAGLLLLIATPVLRVAISIVTFAVEKDWAFVAITSAVLGLLLLSLFLGKVG